MTTSGTRSEEEFCLLWNTSSLDVFLALIMHSLINLFLLHTILKEHLPEECGHPLTIRNRPVALNR